MKIHSCTDCNALYWHPNEQQECYVCGNDSFTSFEVETKPLE